MAIERVFNRYSAYGISDRGKCREINEDTILLNAGTGLFLLADGMGGHRNGDKASSQAVSLINALIEKHLPIATDKFGSPGLWKKFLGLLNKTAKTDGGPNLESQSQLIADILIETNRIMYRSNAEAGFADGGMGTTLVGCKIAPDGDKLQVFHVGDSRLYRIRRDAVLRITKDHSMYQLWLDGGQIGKSPASNKIYQAIGPAPAIKPDVQILDVEANDAFLMCSDGLTELVSDEVITDMLQDVRHDNIEEKACALVDRANSNGGTDNISVILICR